MIARTVEAPSRWRGSTRLPLSLSPGLLPGLLLGLVLAAGTAVLSSTATATPGVDVMPHRAVYDMDLDRVASNSEVTQASGRFEFEWVDLCRGWQVTQRTRIEVAYRDGQVVDFGWSLTSWEAKDGSSYNFVIQRVSDQGEIELVRGKARIEAQGGLGSFTLPTGREIDLPAGTVLPTRHSIELLEAANAGELPLWRWVFSGTGDDGLFGIFATQLRDLPVGTPARLDSPLLKDQRSWRIQMGFFNRDDPSGAPEQEQILRIFANGVVDQLNLDYGDFSLEASLVELEQLVPDC